jgi:hypothetical protein
MSRLALSLRPLELHLASRLWTFAPKALGIVSSCLPTRRSVKSLRKCGRFADREPSPSLVARRWERLPPVESGVWPHITREVVVRRRQFLLTGLASALVGSAAAQEQKAQEQKADAELDLGPVKGTEELWFLLTALDTLIFCLAIAVIKDEAVIVQARREVQPYSSQLSDPKAEEAFNAALKSSDGQARIEQNKTAINDAAKEIDALLTDVVSPPVRASVVRAFARSSTLLVARAAENQSWWCRVYAFRKVRC